MQVWRIRVQNINGVSISWSQALKRFMVASFALFLALLGLYNWGSWSLIIVLPGLFAAFWPINGESLTDRLSSSQLVRLPNPKQTAS